MHKLISNRKHRSIGIYKDAQGRSKKQITLENLTRRADYNKKLTYDNMKKDKGFSPERQQYNVVLHN